MSAIRSRRKRGTWMALGATVLALIAAIALSLVGISTLADSKAGQLASGGADLPVQRLPYTPTALLGTVDEDGRLTGTLMKAGVYELEVFAFAENGAPISKVFRLRVRA